MGFHSVLRLITANRPRLLILENVRGLAAPTVGGDGGLMDSDAEYIKKELESLGFWVKVLQLDARDYGSVSERKRLYFLGAHRAAPDADVFVTQIMQGQVCGPGRMEECVSAQSAEWAKTDWALALANAEALQGSVFQVWGALGCCVQVWNHPLGTSACLYVWGWGGGAAVWARVQCCFLQANKSTRIKADLSYKEHHCDFYREAGLPWPPVLETYGLINYRGLSRRASEVVFFLHERFPGRPPEGQDSLVQFVDVNTDLKRLMVTDAQGVYKDPWRLHPQTLTGQSKVVVRATTPTASEVRPLWAKEYFALSGWFPCVFDQSMDMPEVELSASFAGNCFSAYHVGPALVALFGVVAPLGQTPELEGSEGEGGAPARSRTRAWGVRRSRLAAACSVACAAQNVHGHGRCLTLAMIPESIVWLCVLAIGAARDGGILGLLSCA